MNPRNLLLSIAIALLACGGGGGGGSDFASGGIGGTGVSQGPITGFGSRVVTGTSWDVDNATISSDGVSSFSEADLELGIVVTIVGTRSADGLTGTADTVDFDSQIRGPVANVVAGPGADETSFSVLGVPVLATGGTVLEPANLDLFSVTEVEVYGLVGSSGQITATRIEDESGSTEAELQGTVVDPAADRFDLDLDANPATAELTVLFDAGGACAALTVFDPASLRNELATMPFVEVEGEDLGGGTVCANRVELEDDDFDQDDEVDVEGIVTDFAGLADFRVAGTPVNASAAVFFPPTLAATLDDDVRVEAEGTVDAAGVLQAEEVREIAEEIRISAGVDSVDLGDGTLTVLGIVIETDGDTEFDGTSAALDEIVQGDFVELEAVRVDATTLVAEEIENLGNVVADVELRGPVEAVDTASSPRRLTILGLTFEADAPETDFEDFEEDPLGADRFYERVRPGDIVEARDCSVPPTTVIDVACEVEFED